MTAGWKIAESDEPSAKPDIIETEDKADEESGATAVGTYLRVNRWFCCR